MSVFFRRRTVWLPTAGFALALVVALVLATVLMGRHLGSWLAVTAKAAGVGGAGARTLVVEGWMDEPALEAAVAVYRLGRYDRVLVSGGPIEDFAADPRWVTYADRATAFLARRGLAGPAVVGVPAMASDHDRTFLSAAAVRAWMAAHAMATDAIDVVSAGVHARRSRQMYRIAFGPDTEVGIVSVRGRRDDAGHWWRTSRDVKATVGEVLSIAWTSCCFRPAAPGRVGVRPAASASS